MVNAAQRPKHPVIGQEGLKGQKEKEYIYTHTHTHTDTHTANALEIPCTLLELTSTFLIWVWRRPGPRLNAVSVSERWRLYFQIPSVHDEPWDSTGFLSLGHSSLLPLTQGPRFLVAPSTGLVSLSSDSWFNLHSPHWACTHQAAGHARDTHA